MPLPRLMSNPACAAQAHQEMRMGTLAATPESLTLRCDGVGQHAGAVTLLAEPATPGPQRGVAPSAPAAGSRP